MPILPQQQQAPPQQAPQQTQGQGAYPANKQEAEKFVAGIVQSLHNDKTRPGIMKQLTIKDMPVAARIGNVVAQVITAVLVRVQQQAKRKPQMQMIVKAIQMTVKEVSKMLELTGEKVTPEDRKEAAGMAGTLIDKGMRGKNGPPQGTPQQAQQQPMPPQVPQQVPQQQGLLGGMQ